MRSLRILPIRDTSFTTPDPTKTAQTCTAEASTSGVESAPKDGVRAAAIGAWCCSRSKLPSKSGSGAVENRWLHQFSAWFSRDISWQSAHLDDIAQDDQTGQSDLHDQGRTGGKGHTDEVGHSRKQHLANVDPRPPG